MAVGDTSIALGGGSKAFHRPITGSAQYAPDGTTKGTRDLTSGAAGNAIINAALAAVVQTVTTGGSGFIVPPGESFIVYFTGWTDATCVIQNYNPFTDAWETVFTWPSTGDTPLVAQLFTSKTFYPLRIGASVIGADAATLKLNIQFAQSDRQGF
jgi:hypothetical protein